MGAELEPCFKEPAKMSNPTHIVQVFCTGMDWVDTKHNGNSEQEALQKADELKNNDDSWMRNCA
jgi:hypothetical protein